MPQIIDTQHRLTAVIHVRVPREEIQDVMAPALQELMSAVAAQGGAPAGPWFTHHLTRPSESFDFEVSVPVARPISQSGRVRPAQWPVMRAARTVYHGEYEGLGEAWSEFLDWVEENGHEATQDLWEVYAVGPETSSNPEDWRTELVQPLKSAGAELSGSNSR